MRNFAAAEPWTGTIEKFAAVRTIGSPPKPETWLLTCRSASGRTLAKRNLRSSAASASRCGNVCGPARPRCCRPPAAAPSTSGCGRAGPASIRSLLRNGMKVRVSCARRCATLLRLRTGRKTIASKRVRLRGGRSKVVRLRVSRRMARKLRSRKALKLNLSATGRALTGAREVRRASTTFTVRR